MATLRTNHVRKERRNRLTIKPLSYDPLAGTSIQEASSEAVRRAKAAKRAVTFRFNGIHLNAPPSRKITKEVLAKSYEKLCRKAHEEWHEEWQASPEAIARVEAKQNLVAVALEALPRILAVKKAHLGHDLVMRWLLSLVENADGARVSAFEWLAQQFIAAGYKQNDLVSEPEESFNTRERMGRWVIGQAVDCFQRGMPPHPITQKFIQAYFRLPFKS